METKNLQIHSPKGPHYPAFVVGTPEALQDLAIAASSLAGIQRLAVRAVKTFSGDGEEYDLNVICVPSDSRYWDNLQPPYTEDFEPQGTPPANLLVEIMNLSSSETELLSLEIEPPPPPPAHLRKDTAEDPSLKKLKGLVEVWMLRHEDAVSYYQQQAMVPGDSPGDTIARLRALNEALEGYKLLLEIKRLTGV